MLSVFPADFDRAGAAAVWKMNSDSAAEALSDLFKLSLVEYQDAAGRYHLHDLARDFAASRLETAAEAEARQRHAVHYQRVLWEANNLLLKGGESLRAGLGLFDSEWMNIQAGQVWAESNTATSTGIAQICCDFAWAGSILGLRLHPRDNVRWLKAALVAARQIKNKDAEGAHLGNLGLAYAALGDARKAIEYYEQALAIAKEIGDRRGEGNALWNMSPSLDKLGQRPQAIECATSTLKIFEQIESPLAESVRRTLAEWQG